MVQRMPAGDVVVKRVLGDIMGVQQAIIDADSTLSQSLQRQDLKQHFSQFMSMDQKCLDNYRQVLQSIGGGQSSPSKDAQSLINDCKQGVSNPSNSDAEKIGWYNLMVYAVNQGNNLLAQYGLHKGDENIARLMSENFLIDANRTQMTRFEAVKDFKQML